MQYLKDPALNPVESSMWMFIVRGRRVFARLGIPNVDIEAMIDELQQEEKVDAA